MDKNDNSHISSQGFEYGVKHFYSTPAKSLVEFISETLNINFTDITHLLNLGAIYVDNYRQTKDVPLKDHLLIRVHTKPRRFNCEYNWRERIIFENQDFIILNKPSGIPSHPSVDNCIDNSLHQLSLYRKTPLFITHRLDTLTEGLIVYAKNSLFVKEFNHQLQARTIDKKYVALVETQQTLPSRLIHYMQPSPRAPKTVSQVFQEGWALCELEILDQKQFSPTQRWIKINLLTGRTHQIRSQLSELKAPVCGDQLYGATEPYKPGAIALRAFELEFNWEDQRMKFNLEEEFN